MFNFGLQEKAKSFNNTKLCFNFYKFHDYRETLSQLVIAVIQKFLPLTLVSITDHTFIQEG